MSTVPINQRPSRPSKEIEEKLPMNLDAERCVLGAALIDDGSPNKSLRAARELLTPDDFFLEQNKRIFRNMCFVEDAGRPVETVSLVENLQLNGELESSGGAPYISSLMDGMPRLTNVHYYAKIVKEKSRLRHIIHVTQRIQTD